MHFATKEEKKERVFTNYLNVCLLDPTAVEQVLKITVEEGGHVTEECKVSAGTPSPTFFWKIVDTREVIYGKLLNITNIRRNQRGEYKCFANNTCGSDSSTVVTDVQCKNQDITLIIIHCLFSLSLVIFNLLFDVFQSLLSLQAIIVTALAA